MKISNLLMLIAAVVGAAILARFVLERAPGRGGRGSFGKRRVVTPNEQSMYWRLVEAFPPPEFVVLAQVSFGALLTAKGGASRYSFSQKIADFVVMDKSFGVLAVVELDDSSHQGKEEADASRDAMLTQAGYKVLRYPRIPPADRVRSDVIPPRPEPIYAD